MTIVLGGDGTLPELTSQVSQEQPYVSMLFFLFLIYLYKLLYLRFELQKNLYILFFLDKIVTEDNILIWIGVFT